MDLIRTNKLYTLRQREWVEKYPPMNTAHSHPAVVSTSDGEHLIVIGGRGGGGSWTATVELFQVKSRRWYQLTDLPQHLSHPSATICGDQLNVIGIGYQWLLVFSFLSSIQRSTNHIPSHPILETSPSPTSETVNSCHSLWTASSHWWLARSCQSVNSIHQLVGGEWAKIGSMASDREDCLVVSPSPDEIIIVGGLEKSSPAVAYRRC